MVTGGVVGGNLPKVLLVVGCSPTNDELAIGSGWWWLEGDSGG